MCSNTDHWEASQTQSPTERKAGVKSKTEGHSQEVRAAQQQAQTWQMEIARGQ